MNIKEYVDDLFAKYPDSADMADFKEEVCVNLQERIDYLIKKGASHEDAFEKATGELGDISEIADQLSNNKRKEVIGDMYMKTRNYMSKRQIIGYIASGGLLAFCLIVSPLAYLASGEITAGLGSLMVFGVASICGFVFLGLTQETACSYPMNWKRALLYTAAVGVILFGLIVPAITYFDFRDSIFGDSGAASFEVIENGRTLDVRVIAALGSLIPFALPGSIILAFLILTEKSRTKPWVAEQQAAWSERMKEQFADPYTATRFGLYSGALWISAVAAFIVATINFGIIYSWLAFVAALVIQMLALASFSKGAK